MMRLMPSMKCFLLQSYTQNVKYWNHGDDDFCWCWCTYNFKKKTVLFCVCYCYGREEVANWCIFVYWHITLLVTDRDEASVKRTAQQYYLYMKVFYYSLFQVRIRIVIFELFYTIVFVSPNVFFLSIAKERICIIYRQRENIFSTYQINYI